MTDTAQLVPIGTIDEFVEGEMRVVVADGKEVGVIRWNGELLAVLNVCPHRGAPVCAGIVSPHITVDEGALRLNHDRPVLACSWHRWEFDVRTGRALHDPSRLRTFAVSVDDDGQVALDLRARARA